MRKRSLIYWLSLVFCTTGVLLCGGLFLHQWEEYRTGEVAYSTLAGTVVTGFEDSPSQPQEILPDKPEESTQEEHLPQVDFETLESINSDVVGWLYCPDTVISYPVVQGKDNTYYLDHLFDGTRNGAGCLFLDCQCVGLEGKNSVIYGHCMKNGTLFASLEKYQDQTYYDAHPSLFLLTPEGTLTIELFSAYVTGASGDAWQLTFSSVEEYGTWLEELQEQSCFKSNVVPRTSDRVMTLSTCNYTFQSARFVCHGLVRES